MVGLFRPARGPRHHERARRDALARGGGRRRAHPRAVLRRVGDGRAARRRGARWPGVGRGAARRGLCARQRAPDGRQARPRVVRSGRGRGRVSAIREVSGARGDGLVRPQGGRGGHHGAGRPPAVPAAAVECGDRRAGARRSQSAAGRRAGAAGAGRCRARGAPRRVPRQRRRPRPRVLPARRREGCAQVRRRNERARGARGGLDRRGRHLVPVQAALHERRAAGAHVCARERATRPRPRHHPLRPLRAGGLPAAHVGARGRGAGARGAL